MNRCDLRVHLKILGNGSEVIMLLVRPCDQHVHSFNSCQSYQFCIYSDRVETESLSDDGESVFLLLLSSLLLYCDTVSNIAWRIYDYHSSGLFS